MSPVLCEVKIPMTAEQRRQLQLACQRLRISWPEVRRRVMAASQDAATRAICQLLHESAEQSAEADGGGYPDCATCREARAAVCGECETSAGVAPAWCSTSTAGCWVAEGQDARGADKAGDGAAGDMDAETARIIAALEEIGDELLGLVQRLSALRGRPGDPGRGRQ